MGLNELKKHRPRKRRKLLYVVETKKTRYLMRNSRRKCGWHNAGEGVRDANREKLKEYLLGKKKGDGGGIYD